MKYVVSKFSEKIYSIESTINSEITDAKHIMYGLAISISEMDLINNPSKLNALIHNFDPRYNHDEEVSIPFVGLTVINSSGNEVTNTVKRNGLHNNHHFSNKTCLKESGSEPFSIKVSPIRKGNYSKVIIIPINMKIEDINGNYAGIICSGLVLSDLADKLKLRYGYSRQVSGIKIVNFPSYDSFHIDVNTLSKLDLLKSLLFENDIFFVHKLSKYPLYLEVQLKHYYLKQSIERFLVFNFVFILLVIIGIYYLVNYYKNPLEIVHKKLSSLNQAINSEARGVYLPHPITDVTEQFIPRKFAREVENMIDSYYNLHLERTSPEAQHNEIQKKIVNLIFIEQHFLTSQKTKISEEKLYLNKLLSIVEEENITMNIIDFLEQTSRYLSEYYYETNITIAVEKKDRKDFNFKKSALIEAIFNIFTFTMREKLDTEKLNFNIKAKFIDKNDFPTITIEVDYKNSKDALGWSSGPYYVHTSLLSIYLLAKENKLFFNISKKADKILFILDPISKKIEFYNMVLA